MLARAVAMALVASALLVSRPVAAAPCGASGTPTTTVYLPNITKTLGGPSGWVTPFIVQNVGTASTTLEVSFYRFSDGGLVTCRSVPGLLPGTSFADVPNNDTDLPGDSQFSVVVRSFGAPVVGVVNEHQGSGTRAEALSYGGLTAGATRVGLPYVAKFDASYRSAGLPYPWLTTFVIQNLGAQTATVTIAFASHVDSAQAGRTATLTRTIAPGRSAAVDPSAESAVATNTEYAVVLTSTEPVGVIANVHGDAPTATSPMAYSYNGIPLQSGDAYLPWVAKNADGRSTRLWIQNLGTADATPTVTLRRIGGTEQTSSLLSSRPALKQGEGYHVDLLSPTADGEHAVVVSGGSFAVLGDSRGTTSVMGAIAGPSAPSRVYLPNITRTLGGATGWTTPIVVQSAGATTGSARWYRFTDGTLAVTQYLSGLSAGASLKLDPLTVAGLADNTQYAVVIDGNGPLRAIVLELSAAGGDGAMSYEGFAATGTLTIAPAPTTLTLSPATANVGTGSTQQLTATVKDQSGNAYTGVPITWGVSPPTAGTISASGVFTAGQNAGTATVTATFGTLSATATLTIAAATVTSGGFTFNVRATTSADLYIERTISTSDAETIVTTVESDVASVQTTYGRTYTTRPPVYVFPTTSTYTTGMQSVIGVTASEAVTIGAQTSGFFRWQTGPAGTTTKVALNWERVKTEKPVTTLRHELTHMMIQQITKETDANPVPAWINEGSAVQQEFTISGTEYHRMRYRYAAASMVAVRNYFTLEQLTSQETWNARTGDASVAQYYEASQIVQLLRDDVGTAGVTRIFDLMGQGQVFETAFQTVAGKTVASFSSSVATRLQAFSQFYPYIATAPDEPGGVGLSYILYGFAPSSTVNLDIVGLTKGFENTTKTWTVDAYGVRFIYFGSSWPADTYSFTASGLTPPSSTQPNITTTVKVTAVKAASVEGLTLTW